MSMDGLKNGFFRPLIFCLNLKHHSFSELVYTEAGQSIITLERKFGQASPRGHPRAASERNRSHAEWAGGCPAGNIKRLAMLRPHLAGFFTLGRVYGARRPRKMEAEFVYAWLLLTSWGSSSSPIWTAT